MKRTSRASLQFQWWPRCNISSHDWCTCLWSHTSCKRCLCYGSYCIPRKNCQIWHCLLPSRHCSRGFSYGLLADLPLAAMCGQKRWSCGNGQPQGMNRSLDIGWHHRKQSDRNSCAPGIVPLLSSLGNYNWLSDIASKLHARAAMHKVMDYIDLTMQHSLQFVQGPDQSVFFNLASLEREREREPGKLSSVFAVFECFNLRFWAHIDTHRMDRIRERYVSDGQWYYILW